MSQEYIDFGAFPDDPTADAIRTAFQKTQNNFNELFLQQSTAGVTSLNSTSGLGVTVNQPTGNVILTANIACVQVSTSTLSMGRDSNGGTGATITQSSQTLVIDLPPSLNTQNIAASGNLTVLGTANFAGNVIITGGINLSGNIVVNNLTANTVVSNTIAGALTTNSQPNITSVGNLNSLTVIGNTVLGNFVGTFANGNSNIRIPSANGPVVVSAEGNANILYVTGDSVTVNGNLNASNSNLGNTATANYFVGTIATANQPNITSLGTLTGLSVNGNSNLGNTATANFFAGTLTSSSQPNITSVGTLGNLAVTGNITSGNATLGNTATANFFVGNGAYLTDVVTVANSQIVSGTSNVRIYDPNASVTISVSNTANVVVVSNTDANFTTNINSTGNLLANNIISNYGINANSVTASSFIGTINTGSQPNITSLGALTGLNVSGNSNLGPVGNITVTGGSNGYYLRTNGLGGLSWSGLYSPPGGSNGDIQINDQGNLGAATGLTWNLTTNTLTASNGTLQSNNIIGNFVTGTLATSAQPNITSVGTLTSLIVSGNINSSNVFGGNVVSANYVTGIVTTNAQPNITSVGTLTELNVNGTITAANFTANTGVFTGNGSGLTAIAGGNITGTVANATYAANAGGAVTANTVTANDQPNITSVGSLTSLIVSGNINASNVSGGNLVQASYFQGTLTTASQPNITSVGTLTSLSVAGNSNLGNLATANFVSGTLTTSSQPNITSVGTLANLSVTGNTSTGNLSILGATTVTGNLSSDNANLGNLATANFVTGTLTTSSQPNITTVGTLSNLNVASTITAANFTANTGVFTGNGSGLSAIAGANVTGTVANATQANNATTAGTVTTNAQPNITSIGTLTSLDVSGNITAANITANTGVFTGNGSGLSAIAGANVTGTVSTSTTATTATTAGTVTTAAQPNITSVGTLTGLTVSTTITGSVSGSAATAGTVTTAAQPSITSVGTLTSVSVTGNASAGNLSTSGVISATGNGTFGNVITGGIVSSTGNLSAGNLSTSGVLTVTGTGLSSIAGDLDMTGNAIINLATPVNAQDAATKQYVDDVAQGLHTHDSCNAATTTTLAITSGGTVTYNNGVSGVGANLTTTGSFNLIDGVNVQIAGTRILVKDEANTAHNGIYVWSNITVITRATDFDTPTEMAGGDFTFVNGGTLYDNSGWVMPDPVPIVGTSPVTWTQFSGAGTYQAGTGLTLTGSVFSVNAAQSQITSVGTLTSLSVTGNIAGGNLTTGGQVVATGNVSGLYFIGNGSQLTGIDATAIQNGSSNVRVFLNANVAISAAGNANIFTVTGTGVNVAGTLNATGNAAVGNITASQLISNVATGTAPLTVTSTTRVANLNVSYANVADFINVTTQTSGNSYLLLGNALTGNIAETANAVFVANASNGALYATTFVGGLSGTANLANFATVANSVAGANVTGTVANATFATTAGSATTAGTVTTNAQPNITSVGFLTSLEVIGNTISGNFASAGNVAASRLISNVATGTAPLTVTSTTRVANLSVAYANVADFVNVTAPGTGTAYIIGANATTGNVTEYTSSGISMNLANNAITATTFIGTLSGGAVSSTTAGTVTTNAQPNITSVGTLTGLAVSGNANVGNLGTAGVIVSSIATGTAPLSVVSTTKVANLNVDQVDGYDTSVTATANTIAVRDANANLFANTVTAVNFTANTGVFTGNGNGLSALNASNISAGTLDQARLANASVTFNGQTVALGSSGTITSNTIQALTIGTGLGGTSFNGGTAVTITNNGVLSLANGGGITASASTGAITLGSTATNANTANAIVSRDASGNFSAGTITANLTGTATSAGTITTNAQPNITSVGTLANLTVTGNANVGNLNSGGKVIGADNFVINSSGSEGGQLVLAWNGITGLTGQANSTWNMDVDSSNNYRLFYQNASGAAGVVMTGYSGNNNVLFNNNVSVTNGISASTLTSSVATGTAPLTVTSTTRVANLNVSYANVADFVNITTGSAGNAYLLFGNALTGNIAETANSAFVANFTSGTLYATTFVGAVSGAATSATTAGTVTTNAQPNITSVGTLTSLGVNGNITAANITANTGVFTGNGSGLSAIAGGNVTGTVANATYAVSAGSATTATSATTAGTVTTAAQPNITSVGTLTSLSVTGNASAGNLSTSGVLTVTGTGVSSIAGDLDMTGNTITNLATPVNAQDAATKQYVDDVAQGLHTHGSCNAATTTTLATISGGTVTYLNGVSGVGANLTTTGTFTTVDGVTLTNGMRILVKNEANAAHNGIYTRTNTTVLTRATDFDTPTEMAGGDFTFVNGGSLYDNTGWVMTDPVTTVGTSAVVWVQFSGAGTYQAGTGLTLTGSVFSVNAAQSQITSVGTLTSLGVSGTVTAPAFTANTGVFTGNGSGLSAIAGANVTGTVANATYAVSAGTATSATTAGTVTTAAQGNITSLGTLTGLGVNGTVTAVAFTANTGVFTGNGSGLTSIPGGNVTGAVTTATSATTAGTVTTAAQPNITSTGTLTSLNVTGNISAGNVSAFIFTATGVFDGAGGNLRSLNASNISAGTLAQARLANSSLTVNGTAISLGGSGTITANTTQVLTLGSYLTGTSFNGGTAVTAAVDATSDNTASKVVARDASGNFSAGTITATLNGSATSAGTATTATSAGTATKVEATVSGTNSAELVRGNMADNDQFRILVGGAATNQGYVEIATADDGTEPIYVRQYSGVFTSLTRTATLLDGAGNTIFPGSVSASSLIGNGSGLSSITGGNVTGTVANATYAVSAGSATTAGSATSATTAGTVTTAAQGNITSLGTLTGLGVNGTVTASAFTANTGVFTGNGSGLSALNASNISSGTLAQARLANSSLTVNGTAISLGGSGTVTATATNALTIGTGLSGSSYNGSSAVTITNTGVTSIVAGTNIAVSGATGAVTVNVTGTVANATYAVSAGSATNASYAYNYTQGFNSNWNTDFQDAPAGSTILRGDTSSGSSTGGPGGSWWFQQNMRHTNSSNFWGTQVAWGWEDNANRLATRNVQGGSYGSWVYYLNSSNFNSYAPTLTGGGASGNWGINITGSAATAGTANTTQTLTIGTGLGGTSFNGGTAVTITNTGVTSIVAGTNISVSAATGAVTVNVTGTVANATYAVSAGSATTATNVTGTVAIANGGTGSTTAAGALTNLGAYPASNPSGYTTNTGTVTGVTATAPVVSSGGTAPVISMAAASSGVNGYMTGVYATKLDGIAAGATNVTNTNQLTNGAGFVTSSGTVAKANTFSSTNANYKGVTDSAVAGQLMWKEYGNGHTIFDASDATSPAGGAVNRTNPNVPWEPTLPTLMGWDGSSTYGVRVDSANTAGTVTTAAQGNITSVGTLTSLSTGNVTNSGYFIRSVATGIVAAGTASQAGSTGLTKEINVVSTVPGASGVRLPAATAGMMLTIINTTATSLLVFPASGAAINTLAANGFFSHSGGATLQYVAVSATQWYTVGATYA